MNISELIRDQATPAHRPSQAPDPHALLAHLGGEVARRLSSALERISTLATTGRIDRSNLLALQQEIDHARRAGIAGQQVSRFAAGRIQATRERLDLTALLLEAMRQRRRDIETRGVAVRPFLDQAEATCDATLAYSLFQSLFDWALEHADARIDLKLDLKPWPAHARLTCAFGHRPEGELAAGDSAWLDHQACPLDTMSWFLLQQTAVTLGLVIHRHDTTSRTTLTLEFPETVVPRSRALSDSAPDDTGRDAHHAQPLAGRHALVVASRREVRSLVRDALRPMGLMIDFVNSVEEAGDFCRDSVPHAVVYEAALAGDRFEKLRTRLVAALPTMAFVQIAEHGKAFEVLDVGSRPFASVGRDALLESLPAALMFEMARSENRAAPR